MARSGFDSFIGVNTSSTVAGLYVADLPMSNAAWSKWEGRTIRIFILQLTCVYLGAALVATKKGNFQYMAYYVLTRIYDTRSASLLARALAMCSVTWDVSEVQAEALSTGHWSLEMEERVAFFQAPETTRAVLKAVVAAYLPHSVEKTELVAFLPIAEAQFADLNFKYASGKLLSLLCSSCAQLLGDTQRATMYAAAELGNFSPFRQLEASSALAVSLCPPLPEANKTGDKKA
jgi:hypothetical protein